MCPSKLRRGKFKRDRQRDRLKLKINDAFKSRSHQMYEVKKDKNNNTRGIFILKFDLFRKQYIFV